MNVHEAIKVLLTVSGIDGAYTFHPAERRITIIAAQSVAAEIISKYDALAPDWANAPEWAQWYCVDASGDAQWTVKEPEASEGMTGWILGTAWEDAAGQNGIDLPLGIDWRLCKWSRPEVTK